MGYGLARAVAVAAGGQSRPPCAAVALTPRPELPLTGSALFSLPAGLSFVRVWAGQDGVDLWVGARRWAVWFTTLRCPCLCLCPYSNQLSPRTALTQTAHRPILAAKLKIDPEEEKDGEGEQAPQVAGSAAAKPAAIKSSGGGGRRRDD